MATWNEEKVKKVLKQDTKKKLITVMEGDFNALKKQAENFMKVVRDVSKKRKITASKEKLSEAIKIVTSKMGESQVYTQEIINAQHIFDMNINAFINRTIYLTYVYPDGGLSFYNELNVGKLYDAFITKGPGVGKFQTALLKDWSDLEEILNERIKASAAANAWTYTESIRRWEKNNSGDKKVRMKYKDSYQTIYWRLYDSHHVSGWSNPISNRGHIAEAYARCIINDDRNIDPRNKDWAILYLYSLVRHDSTSGLAEGDVQLKEDGSIHFAIKSGNFQTPGTAQYIRLAYNILQIPSMNSKEFEENLEALLDLTSTSEEIVQAAQEKAKKVIQNTADSVTKT